MADNMDNIVSLIDDEGNEVEFEVLDVVEYEGEEYVVLLPADEEAEDVLILLIENADTDEESYVTVDDEDKLMKVFEIFKERNEDEFNFQ